MTATPDLPPEVEQTVGRRVAHRKLVESNEAYQDTQQTAAGLQQSLAAIDIKLRRNHFTNHILASITGKGAA